MADHLTLKCPDCGHENEPERVYCHNCGAKLDRSILPKAEQREDYETPDETRRRVTKMMSPGGSWVKRDFGALIKVLIFGVLVAAIFLYWCPPEDRPDVSKNTASYIFRDDWTRQMESRAASVMEYKESDANDFLKTLKGAEGSIPGVKFKGASVRFRPGSITIFVEREIWGLSMWSSIDVIPSVKDGKFTPEITGVHYGRLGIDPRATFAQMWGVQPVLDALKRDINSFARIQSVDAEEGRVIITTKP